MFCYFKFAEFALAMKQINTQYSGITQVIIQIYLTAEINTTCAVPFLRIENTELFEMTVGILTTCHTQYT